MKAAVYEGPRSVAILEVPDPQAEAGGILIRVRACSICGTDLRIYNHGDTKIVPPRIIGHEIVGEVVEVGEGVTAFSVGDRVALAPPGVHCGQCAMCSRGFYNLCLSRKIVGYAFDGGFAEYVAIPARLVEQGNVLPIPDGLSYEKAAVTEPLACVVHGQRFLDIFPGASVVVIGAGAIGLMHAQLARAKGAGKIFVADIAENRLKLAERFGFDALINSAASDPVQEVLRLTGGLGADVAIVAASAPPAVEQALYMLAKRGQLSLFAGMPKDNPKVSLDINRIHYYEISVYGTSASMPEDAREALSWIVTGGVDAEALVTHTVALDDLIPAMEMMRRGESLKIVVRP